jgi:hypothetical protein
MVSTDETTGIQALERRHPTRPMQAGKPEAQEFEYIRHGTQALIANFEVAPGRVIGPMGRDTRTEEDFVDHSRATVDTDPEAPWGGMVDPLNPHKSAGLVRLIAERCGVEEDVGVKGESGRWKDMDSRAHCLQDARHRISLGYTPKHCSWLNQLEIWFGILVRRLLKRGSFVSKAEVKLRILAFIEGVNQTLAKPFRWTYIGKPLMV